MTKRLLPITMTILSLPAILAAQQVGFIEHPITSPFGEFPNAITLGPDGALWFTEVLGVDAQTSYIGRMTKSGSVTSFPVPTSNIELKAITAGPDGALWFTESTGGKIGRITTEGVITEYPVTSGSAAYGIVTGPDGALWFTAYPGEVGRITTAGVVTEYPTPTPNSDPQAITVGSDGALWFTEPGINDPPVSNIGRITTAGVITEYPTPTPSGGPDGITKGPDGAIWFTEYGVGKIGRISGDGTITEYPVPTAGSGPTNITPGPEGDLWFTEYVGNIGRITTAGAVTEYPVPSGASQPSGIARVPGAIWFTEMQPGKIGQLVFETAVSTISPDSGTPASSISIEGNGFAPNEKIDIFSNSTSGSLLETATADASGSFTVAGKVPLLAFGHNSWISVGQNSKKVAVAQFYVKPLVTVTPAVVAPGGSITIQGYGFAGAVEVDVYLGTPNILNFIDKAETNDQGVFPDSGTVTYAVPTGTQPGSYVLTALSNGTLPANLAEARFTVQ